RPGPPRAGAPRQSRGLRTPTRARAGRAPGAPLDPLSRAPRDAERAGPPDGAGRARPAGGARGGSARAPPAGPAPGRYRPPGAAILGSPLGVRVPGELVGDSDDVHAAPWTSAGGCLHLSDLEHGGFAGREAVFLVGLDADRFPGSGGQDPLLLDADRRALSPELPLSTEVMRERGFRVAAMFARLRGTVTLSHCAWSASEARALPPSPLLLQALRLASG